MHRIELSPALIDYLAAARDGGLGAFGEIDPARTAHIVVDLQNGFMEKGAPVEIAVARAIVPTVNAISAAVRTAGATNIFLRFASPPDSLERWSNFYPRLPEAKREAHIRAFTPGDHYWALWPELDVADGEVVLDKQRFSAFTPGTCDLDKVLRERGIDTLIITGTTTNCCCESTARDAMQLNYRVLFVSDATAAASDAEHNATLNNLASIFADVLPAEAVIGLLA